MTNIHLGFELLGRVSNRHGDQRKSAGMRSHQISWKVVIPAAFGISLVIGDATVVTASNGNAAGANQQAARAPYFVRRTPAPSPHDPRLNPKKPAPADASASEEEEADTTTPAAPSSSAAATAAKTVSNYNWSKKPAAKPVPAKAPPVKHRRYRSRTPNL